MSLVNNLTECCIFTLCLPEQCYFIILYGDIRNISQVLFNFRVSQVIGTRRFYAYNSCLTLYISFPIEVLILLAVVLYIWDIHSAQATLTTRLGLKRHQFSKTQTQLPDWHNIIVMTAMILNIPELGMACTWLEYITSYRWLLIVHTKTENGLSVEWRNIWRS